MTERRSSRLRNSSGPLRVSQEEWLQMAGQSTPMPNNATTTTTTTTKTLLDTPLRQVQSESAKLPLTALVTPLLDIGADKTTTTALGDNQTSQWQFSAPRYADLGKVDDTGNTSQWFENRIISPTVGAPNSPLIQLTPQPRPLRKRSSIASLGPPQRVLLMQGTPNSPLAFSAASPSFNRRLVDDMVVPASPVWKVDKSPTSNNSDMTGLSRMEEAIAPLRRSGRLSQGAIRILKKSPAADIEKKALGIRHSAGVKKRTVKTTAKQVSTTSGLSKHTQKHINRVRQAKPFKSAAQFMKDFWLKTPDRFRTRPKPLDALKPLELTQPVSPNLRTKHTRSREIAQHNEYLEDEEQATSAALKADGKPGFKAHPVNYKVLNSAGDLGVPKIAKPRTTVPKSPGFTKLPSERRKQKEVTAAPKNNNTAKAQAAKSKKLAKVAKEPYEPKLTVPEPFNFVGDAIAANKARRFEERLAQEKAELEEARRFKPAPMPNLNKPVTLPPVEERPLTEPKPFQFLTDERGAVYQAQYKAWIDEIERQNKENREFHAQPIIKGKPIVIQPSTKPTTAFDERIREQQELLELNRQLKEKEDEERQRLEMIEHRKQLEFKANPIVNYPSLSIRRSSKPLTVPQSPAITKNTLRRRRHSERSASHRARSRLSLLRSHRI
ncbi:hypothetical protein BDF19DRAFT_450185 [Syncephalis fuscata]|nr:hypothetical protein BDF19DRAFT_450185 [Syncephalis fuscata]